MPVLYAMPSSGEMYIIQHDNGSYVLHCDWKSPKEITRDYAELCTVKGDYIRIMFQGTYAEIEEKRQEIAGQ